MGIELGQLRALRELGDRGSIAAAAGALHVTASSVSQQLTALQRRFPVPLTYKDGRRTALTDAGHALAAAAIEVEVAFERAKTAVDKFQREPRGTVSVAAFHSAALAFFGPLLTAFTAPMYPRVSCADFDVAQEDFPALTQDHDLVLAHRLAGSPPWPSSVSVKNLLTEPLDLVLRSDHPLTARHVIDVADLHAETWVAVHEGYPLETAIRHIAGIGETEPNIRHRINDFATAATIVRADNCIALMPRYTTVINDFPGLALRPLSHAAPRRHIDCLSRPETLERTNAQRITTALKDIANSLTTANTRS